MATNYKNFVKGIGVVPKAISDNNTKGDLEVLSTDNKLHFYNGTINDPVVTETVTATLTNKILTGNTAANLINGSGQLNINSSGTITVPNGTDTLVGLALTQTLSNKTIAAPTITGLLSGDSISLTGSLTTNAINGTNVASTYLTIKATGTDGGVFITGDTSEVNGIWVSKEGVSYWQEQNSLIQFKDGGNVGHIGISGLTIRLKDGPIYLTNTPEIRLDSTLIKFPQINPGVLWLNPANELERTAGNITTTKQFLTSTGDGVNPGTPTYSTIADADVPTTLTSKTLAGTTTVSTLFNSSNDITVQAAGAGLDVSVIALGGVINLQAPDVNIVGTLNAGNIEGNPSIVLTATSDIQLNPGTEVTVSGPLTLLSTSTLYFEDGIYQIGMRAQSGLTASYDIELPTAAPAANTALVYNGSAYVWGTVSGGYTSSIQTALTASGTITISTTEKQQAIEVQGNGAAVTLSNTPFGTSNPTDKTTIRLVGRSDTNTVTIVNNDAADGCLLNGNITLGLGDAIELMYLASIDRYVEISRNI